MIRPAIDRIYLLMVAVKPNNTDGRPAVAVVFHCRTVIGLAMRTT